MDVRVKTLIADDEPLVLRRLKKLLGERDDIQVVGEAVGGKEAIALVGELEPELVLLDVQMGKVGGFDVLARVGPEAVPAVVFLTEYDKHALGALGTSSVDHLRKPFNDVDFQAVVDQALHDRPPGELLERLKCLVDTRITARGGEPFDRPPRRRIPVHVDRRIFFLPAFEVDYLEADGSRVRLHAGERCYEVHETLDRLERELDPAQFTRANERTLVRVDQIRNVRQVRPGSEQLELRSGERLKLARLYRAKLEKKL